MVARDHVLAAYFRSYTCPSCRSELRQPLAEVTEDGAPGAGEKTGAKVGEEAPGSACAECFVSDLACHQCGDPICKDHARTVEKYLPVFSPELGRQLEAAYGRRLYCSLCIQRVFHQFSHGAGGKVSKSKRVFNLPLILALFLLTLVIIFGVQQCSAAKPLLNEVTYLGSLSNTER